VDLQKAKPPLSSPTFEKLNLERLKQSQQASETAKRAVDQSARLVDESKELIRQIRATRRKSE